MLPRFERPKLGLASILLAAAALAAGMMEGAGHSETSQRMVGAFLGPLLLLAGLHARLEGFIHARARRALLPLPIAPGDHWRQAQGDRRRGLVLSIVAGLVALGLAGSMGALVRPQVAIAEFAWLGLLAAVLEPLVPAYASAYGRRFEDGDPAHRAQQTLGGGWTAPEAVVHLYAPAMGVLGAAAFAMPGQLGIERAFEGMPLRPSHWGLALGPLLIAGLWRRRALQIYASGLFEAVPWLEEAERSLSGRDHPRTTPRMASWVRDPWVRLRLLSAWRRVPGASLRALALVLLPLWFLVKGIRPGGIGIAAFAACTLAWMGPLISMHDAGEAARWQRFAIELPGVPRVGDGARALPLRAWALWALPVLWCVLGLFLAWGAP